MNSVRLTRHVKRLVLCGAPLGMLGLVVLGTYWHIRSGMDRRADRFAVAAGSDVAALHTMIRRLHVGPGLERWELLKTAEAFDRIVTLLSDTAPPDREAYWEAVKCRNYYRIQLLDRGIEPTTQAELDEVGQELVDWLKSRDRIEQGELEAVFRYLNLLKRHSRDREADLPRVAAIESAVVGKLATPMQNQEVRDALAGVRRRSSLLGSRIDLRGKTLAGKTLDVTDMRGRVVLVEFWSTTCAPCIQEIPELKSIYRAYHDRGFEIIGIPLDRFPGGLMATLEEHGIRWPQIWRRGGNRERMRSLGIRSIPSSLLLDRNGRVIALDVRAAAAAPEKRLEPLLRALFRS